MALGAQRRHLRMQVTTNPDGTESRNYAPEDELTSPAQRCICQNCGHHIWMMRERLGTDPTGMFTMLKDVPDPASCPKCDPDFVMPPTPGVGPGVQPPP